MVDTKEDGGNYLGIEIGGTKLQVCAGTSDGRIVERFRFPVDIRRGGGGIRQQLESVLPELGARLRPVAVGVGFGGPVDGRTGQICCSHQIEGWSDFPLGPWLGKLLGVPVQVDNDANVAALAEALSGAGVDHNPVFYVTLGSGVGGGLVVDGQIYHGARPGESEIGHLRLDKSGALVEDRCSGWAVDRRIRAAVKSDPESALARLIGGVSGQEAKHLDAAIKSGDATAKTILSEWADDLAFGLSHVVQLFHPGIIVLGGGLSLLGEPLRVAVKEALPRYTMEAFKPGAKISLAAQAEDAVPVGALLLAADAISPGGRKLRPRCIR